MRSKKDQGQFCPTYSPTRAVREFEHARFEIEMAAHGNGAFFTRHRDTFVREKLDTHRVVSMVYYFHSIPKAFSGGHLRFHSLTASGEGGHTLDIESVNVTAVFFLSWFPHEVVPIACPSQRFMNSRFAINCWIHANKTDRPSGAKYRNRCQYRSIALTCDSDRQRLRQSRERAQGCPQFEVLERRLNLCLLPDVLL